MRWILRNTPDEAKIQTISESLRVPPLIASILITRSYDTHQKIKSYLFPSLDELSDPFEIPNLEQAVERILFALKNRENIGLYGDYDVDGLCGTALLYLVLTRLGANVFPYIPNRLLEGYGLSRKAIKYLKDNNATLLITIDCGITNIEETRYARELGIDVIITDHHEPIDNLPPAYAVVTPKLSPDNEKIYHLAGVGVAFKLAQGLYKAVSIEDEIYQHLDLVALGTVADIVPLIGENRILTRFGLRTLEKTSKPGLRALMQKAHIWGEELATWKIVFILAPRLNSAGRISEPKASLELLITYDNYKAEKFAEFIEKENQRRKQLDEEIFKQAVSRFESDPRASEKKMIIIDDANWHIGVIGIVASRLVEKYFKPTLLISTKNGIGKGSGRSVAGFHLLNAIKSCGEYLLKFGGHTQAAGIAIEPDKIEQFKRAMLEYAELNLPDDTLIPTLTIDAKLDPDEIEPNLIQWLDLFMPFGPQNMRPVFLIENAQIICEPRILNGEHIRFRIKNKKRAFDVIGFNMSDKFILFNSSKPIHLAVVLEKKEWFQGTFDIELKLKDIKSGDWRIP